MNDLIQVSLAVIYSRCLDLATSSIIQENGRYKMDGPH